MNERNFQIAAVGRLEALLDLLYEFACIDNFEPEADADIEIVKVLSEADVLELLNLQGDLFEDHQDVAEHMFHYLFTQIRCVARAIGISSCDYIAYQRKLLQKKRAKFN